MLSASEQRRIQIWTYIGLGLMTVVIAVVVVVMGLRPPDPCEMPAGWHGPKPDSALDLETGKWVNCK